jgi:hypothetical protein
MQVARAWVEDGRGETLIKALGLAEREARCVFAYADPACDLVELGQALASLQVPVVACTTAGQIGAHGFERGGITATAVFSDVTVRSFSITALDNLEQDIAATAAEVHASGVLNASGQSLFGVLLVDGLAGAEERLMATLHRHLPRLPVVGGSAADNLTFTKTQVFAGGAFRSGAAVLHIFATPRRVVPLKLQHHVATEQRLVITRATRDRRTINEIDGLPAAIAYARAIGVEVERLSEPVFAAHPMLLRIGNEHYIRSVRRVCDDGALDMYCAIDQGLVVRLGKATGIVETLAAELARADAAVGGSHLVIGYDCILRRIEIERANLHDDVGALMARHRVIGFSTYGEQFNATHANQTFTGFMIGAVAR